jgi:CzcA family heavy metal efflux pump
MTRYVGRFAIRNGASILFLVLAVAAAGAYSAAHMPSSVFPKTDFPRVVIIAENGVMPADDMMATITRPIEEAMKDIQGCSTIRSSTGRGTAEIDIFFGWDVDMRRAELDVQSRLSQIRNASPPTLQTQVYRMTFSTFPIIGLSLTGAARDDTRAMVLAQDVIKPQLLKIHGVSRVDLVGGRAPEYVVVVDPMRLSALKLDLPGVVRALAENNLVAPAGMHQQDERMYLTVVDGRVHGGDEIAQLTVPASDGHIVPIGDFAEVRKLPEPSLTAVTASSSGRAATDAVLLNIYSDPDASTLDISAQLKATLPDLRQQLPANLTLSFFYDQSLLVQSSVRSVWDAILFGLILSVLILFLFLRDWPMTLVATAVIPITVLVTIVAMRLCGLSFNLMTLGGIAAAIGLVIDDAIVVVEAIHAKSQSGLDRREVVELAVADILPPLVGSTLTPVVVFLPLAFLTGIAGVFFRSLAITMVVALMTSLVLAVTLTPLLAAWVISAKGKPSNRPGFVFRWILSLYEHRVRWALAHPAVSVGIAIFVMFAAWTGYTRLPTDFLPAMDEGGFIIDYRSPAGTSLAATDAQMRQAEDILSHIPEVESFSRRTGTALGVHLDEPNTGDFLVKLKSDRTRTSAGVIADLRGRLVKALPRINWEFPGILRDLIGDLIWEDDPIEVRVISTDQATLEKRARTVEEDIEDLKGVVDADNGLVYTGPSIRLAVRYADAQRYGLSAASIADAVNIAMLGQVASTAIEDGRVVNIRVKADPDSISRIDTLRQLPLKTRQGGVIRLDQVSDVDLTGPQLELHRDDLRPDISVTADLQGTDLGAAMAEVRNALGAEKLLPPGSIEYGGLDEQQKESFANLTIVLLAALTLVFTVALLEFRGFREPIAIVSGAALSTFGIVAALLLTGTTLNIITYLGAIIGMGIVHKNGLLMLDEVKRARGEGLDLTTALVQSGRRRLRPVLMTSLAAGLGMLPLALGLGSADMLRPLAIAVIGAVCISDTLSLVATPVIYMLIAPRQPQNAA